MLSKENIRQKQQIKKYIPLVQRFCMKYVHSFNIKDIHNYVQSKSYDEIESQINTIKKSNINTFERRYFNALLLGLGKYYVYHNECNLLDEDITSFKTLFDFTKRLSEIQVELGSISKEKINEDLLYRVLWIESIKDEIFYPIVGLNIGSYISGEVDDAIFNIYENQFSSLIKKVLDDNCDIDEFEDYLNADDEFEDDIERKVDIEIKPLFYKMYAKILKEEVDSVANEDIFFTYESDEDDRLLFYIVSSTDNSKLVKINSFWQDIERMNRPEGRDILLPVVAKIKERVKNELNILYAESYNKFKNNLEIEPFKKKKMKIKIAKDLEE